jgi:hypothetical protein
VFADEQILVRTDSEGRGGRKRREEGCLIVRIDGRRKPWLEGRQWFLVDGKQRFLDEQLLARTDCSGVIDANVQVLVRARKNVFWRKLSWKMSSRERLPLSIMATIMAVAIIMI